MISSIGSMAMQGMAAQMAQMRAQAFQKSDADASGGLSVDEFKSFATQGPPRPGGGEAVDLEADFAGFDADGDGSLTEAELDAGMASKMAAFRSTVDAFGLPPPPPDGQGAAADDPLQALLEGLQNGDARATQIAQTLAQLIASITGSGEATSTVSTTA